MKQLELSLLSIIMIGEQMIGYGPDISTDDKDGGNKQYNEDPDFHPLPPPITKGTVTTIVTSSGRVSCSPITLIFCINSGQL